MELASVILAIQEKLAMTFVPEVNLEKIVRSTVNAKIMLNVCPKLENVFAPKDGLADFAIDLAKT